MTTRESGETCVMTSVKSRDEVRTAGRVIAWADSVVEGQDDGPHLHVRVQVVSGHLPIGTRRGLLDDVRRRASAARIHTASFAIPLGDSEMLVVLREQWHEVTTRAAGSTCLVTATF